MTRIISMFRLSNYGSNRRDSSLIGCEGFRCSDHSGQDIKHGSEQSALECVPLPTGRHEWTVDVRSRRAIYRKY